MLLVGAGLVCLLIFGIRSLTYGKVKPMSIVMFALPLLVLGALGLILGDWPQAAIISVLIMLGLTSLAMLLSSATGLFN